VSRKSPNFLSFQRNLKYLIDSFLKNVNLIFVYYNFPGSNILGKKLRITPKEYCRREKITIKNYYKKVWYQENGPSLSLASRSISLFELFRYSILGNFKDLIS